MKANLAGFFTVTVDYDRRLERIIEDGRYDWTNPHISSKNFPIEGKGKIDLKIELAHFSRVMESDEVLQELNSQALRPATLPELLAFGASHPDQQRRFPIVALASIWRDGRGRRLVAYLTSIDSERNLYLIPLAGGWHTNYHFAAVRT
jgi:hypothetical protein